MHFTYCVDANEDLMQGDILRKTPEIDRVLNEAHPYYFQNKNNKYLIVLTQSCDLVRRPENDPCAARYISIAPVRPLSLVIERQVQVLIDKDLATDQLPVCSLRQQNYWQCPNPS